MKRAPRISEAEWQVMKALWQHPGASAQTVITALEAVVDWSPATVKTLLNRLVRKGVLRFEKHGKAYLYSPVFTEEECRRVESHSFLQRVFDGALSPMIAHFVQSQRLTPKEIAEIERLLRQNRKTP